jgi:hypothetical protein
MHKQERRAALLRLPLREQFLCSGRAERGTLLRFVPKQVDQR